MKFYATIGVESMMFLISPGSKAGVKSNQVITSSEKMRAVFEIQQVHLQKMLDKMNLILRYVDLSHLPYISFIRHCKQKSYQSRRGFA